MRFIQNTHIWIAGAVAIDRVPKRSTSLMTHVQQSFVHMTNYTVLSKIDNVLQIEESST